MSKHFETIAVRTQMERTQREHTSPLYLTSSFVFDDAEQARAMFADEIEGNIYSRFSNPNVNEFVEKMCLLEGTEDGFGTATGMAAVLRRDLRLAARQGGDWLNPLSFFVMVITLFPLAINTTRAICRSPAAN